jgi:hypothetical protein
MIPKQISGSSATVRSESVAMAKWIRIEERLPSRGESVIVAHRQQEWSNSRHRYYKLKRLGVRPATYWYEDEGGPRFFDGPDSVVDDPVAWMPLPEPPEAK